MSGGAVFGLAVERAKFLGALGLFGASAVALAVVAMGAHKARHERDVTTDRGTAVCLEAGMDFIEHAVGRKGEPGKPLDRKRWGTQCGARIRSLAAFERDALAASNSVLSRHAEEQAQKTTTDVAAVRRNTTRQAHAVERARIADEAVQGDRAGPEFFAALNDLAGLQFSPEAGAGPDGRGGGGEGQPADGHPDLRGAAGGIPEGGVGDHGP